MSDQEQKKQAWVSALRILTASPKSRYELVTKLEKKGYPANVVRETIAELERQNLLSDRQFAMEMFQKYHDVKPSGRRKMAFEMKRHGVPQMLQTEIMENWSAEEEAESARELARDLWRRSGDLPPVKRRKKIYDLLIRRGFDFQLARDILDDLGSEDVNENL